MVLPNFFKTAGDATANYDWIDFASRAGYRTYYPAAYADNGGAKYIMSQRVIDSDLQYTYSTINNTNVELNFDITFQSPVIVAAGDVYINYTTTCAAGTTIYTIFTLYHVRGAAETSIGTTTTHSYENTTGGIATLRELAVLTSTKKAFAIGDKLRLEVKFYSSAAGNSTIAYDPGSRGTSTESYTGATITTDMTVDIPFKIDL